MHLDAGQTDISASSCSICGMVYAAGAAGDDSVHRKHHASFLRGRKVPFGLAVGMRLLDETDTGRNVSVRAGDPAAHIRAMRIMDGFVTGQLGGRSEAFGNFGEGWEGTDDGWMGIVFMVASEAKGYIYAERVDRAQEARVEIDGVAAMDGMEVERVMCGVRKIWVKDDRRRSGIAARLIELARTNLIYGHVIETCDVAFTATTTSGGKLALSLAHKCGRDRILVYTR